MKKKTHAETMEGIALDRGAGAPAPVAGVVIPWTVHPVYVWTPSAASGQVVQDGMVRPMDAGDKTALAQALAGYGPAIMDPMILTTRGESPRD